MKQKYYLTTAIPYANSDPHIGFALELLYADIMARWQRLLGKEVYFLTGTDEHGQKMLRTAREKGKEVSEYASEKSAAFLRLADEWNITNNDFIRTTEERHMARAQKFWEASLANGDIYKKSYTGLYCVGCEAYKTEKDLVDGLCPDHKVAPESLTEENYFFRLSKYTLPLQKLFNEHPDFVYPASRYNEMKNILDSGLDDVSCSRSSEKLSWGIPVPNDPSQVMYVWFDALTNYVTALGYGSEDGSLFQKFWPADAHIIGKEINRFHSLLWPAMLLSAGLKVPKQIVVHGWITVNGQKMSKSLGNVIDPRELVTKYPLDAVRYFLAREIPFEADGDYSEEKFRERYQADLANGLGNFASRVLTMLEKYTDSRIPEVTAKEEGIMKYVNETIWPEYYDRMNKWQYSHALTALAQFVSYCDTIISDRKPWTLAKEGKTEEVNNLLYHLTEALRQMAVMAWPVTPETSENILTQLGLDVGAELSRDENELRQWVGLTVGTKINKANILFPRLT